MNMSINLNTLISYILYGDFGLLTTVPYFLFKILLPLITSFYLFQLFLLESNLLPIIASRLDKSLSKLGLSSYTLLSLLLGFGCVTVALGTLQAVNCKRERRIAQILLCMLVPCSAQLVMNTILLFKVNHYYLLLYCIITLVMFILLSLALNNLFPQNRGTYGACTSKSSSRHTSFKFPHIRTLLIGSLRGSIKFLVETAPPFVLGNIIISLLYFFGFIDRICSLTAPVICDFLQLPADAAAIFILTIMKKDLAASSLLALFNKGIFTEPQIFVVIVMLTLFVPCFASMVVFLRHERKSICVTVWILCVLLSLIVGKILSCLFILPTSC